MWAFPALASIVALAFAALLATQFRRRRRTYQAMWAIALLLYAIASAAVVIGASSGWTSGWFRTYWALGAVLNVPFLAQGEIELLVRDRTARAVLAVLLVFVCAYTIAVTRTAAIEPGALAEDLPSGKDVFGDGSPAHRLPQLISIPAYLVLVGGALWSAWRMRRRRELRDRFWGTLSIALGATVIAGFGSASAALGELFPFSAALLVGISVMFWGFLRASRRVVSAGSAEAARAA